MSRTHKYLVAWVAAGGVACVEPADSGVELAALFTPDECMVVNTGPGIDDGLVGICHATCDGETFEYEYVRVSPAACRHGHAQHELDFRSDDPLCRILPTSVHNEEPVTDTVLAW